MPTVKRMKRISLRTFKESDADAVYSYRSLKEVARFQYWEPFTRELSEAFVSQYLHADINRKGEWIGLAIVNTAEDEIIGDCAMRIDDNRAEVGCNITPACQHRGYAREALSLLLEHCFITMGVGEVVGITDSENIASISLMQSLGMMKRPSEERVFCKGSWCTEYTYGITRTDYDTAARRHFLK